METIEFDKQPIEKALEDWGAEITGINTLLCAAVLGFDREEIARIIREKAARWSTRLEEGCDNV